MEWRWNGGEDKYSLEIAAIPCAGSSVKCENECCGSASEMAFSASARAHKRPEIVQAVLAGV